MQTLYPEYSTKDSAFMAIEKIVKDLQKRINVNYDVSGSVGRRYARNDEIGTPFCITVDHQTIEDQTVTIRHRDTMKQDRVNISDLKAIIENDIRN